MIVKIQRSLTSSDGNCSILVYNEPRTVCWTEDCTPQYLKFLQGEYKKYAHAHLEGNELVIEREAPEQLW